MIVVTDPQQFDIVKDSLLIVEGTDDRRFVGAFLKWLGIANIQIVAVGGTPGFRPFLTNTLINAPNFRRLRSLGIVRDADESAASAFQSICDSLKDASLPVPSKPYMPTYANAATTIHCFGSDTSRRRGTRRDGEPVLTLIARQTCNRMH